MQWIAYVLAPLAALLVGYFTYKSDKKKSVPIPWLTALLRALLAASVVLLLAAPFIKWKQQKTWLPYVIFLQDNSASVAQNLGSDTASFRQKSQELMKALEGQFQVVPLSFSNDVTRDSLFTYSGAGTNIAAAMAALSVFTNPNVPAALVLATDGQFNTGENPVFQNLPLRAFFYGVVLGDTSVQRDIKVGQIYANEIVSAHSQFQITVDVLAQNIKGHSGTIIISSDAQIVAKENISVNDERYDRSFSFTVPSGKPGWKRLTVEVSKADGEENTVNNKRDFYVQVVEQQKKVLLAAYAPHPDIKAIQSAFQSIDQFKLTTVIGSLPSWENFDVVILHQLPAHNIQLPIINKPVWFILGAATHLPSVTQATQLFSNATGWSDALPQFNSAFTLFSFRPGMADGVNKFPPLWSPAHYETGTDAYSIINNLQTGKSLWMLKTGAKTMAVTMGEGIWRWRLYDYKNNGNHQYVDDLIKQTLSFLSAQNNGQRLRVEMNKYSWNEQESIAMSAYFTNVNQELINTPDVLIQLKDSSGNTKQFSMEKVGNAYQLNLGLWQAGTYHYTASCQYQGQSYQVAGSFIVDDQALESLNKGADFNLLSQIAAKYKGSVSTFENISSLIDSIQQNQQLKPVIEERERNAPLIEWRWFFLVILLLATAEWWLRKYWMAH